MVSPVFYLLLLLVSSSLADPHSVKKRMLVNSSKNTATTVSELAKGSICSTQTDQEKFLKAVGIGKSYLTYKARVIVNELLRHATPLPNTEDYEYFKPSDTREYQILAAVAVLFSPPFNRNEKPKNKSGPETHYFNEFFHFVEIGKLVLNDEAEKQLRMMLDDNHISMNLTKEEALKAYYMDEFRVLASLGRMFFLAIEEEKMVRRSLAEEKNWIKEFLRVDPFEDKWRAINDKYEIESDHNYEKTNSTKMPYPMEKVITNSTPTVFETAEMKTTAIELTPTVPTTLKFLSAESTVPASIQRSLPEPNPSVTKTTGFQTSAAESTPTISTTQQPKKSTAESSFVSTTRGLKISAIESTPIQLTTIGLGSFTAEPTPTVPVTTTISTLSAKSTSTLLTTIGWKSSTAESTSTVPVTTTISTSAAKSTSPLLAAMGWKSSTAESTPTVPVTTTISTSAFKSTSTLLTIIGWKSSTAEPTSTVPVTTVIQNSVTESTPTSPVAVELKTTATK